jgi:fatty acid desaturase
VLAFSPEQHRAKRGRVSQFIARRQGYLFLPLLMAEAVQLHASSIQALIRRGIRHRTWEAILLGLHVAGYLAAVLLVLSPVKAAVFIVVHQALFGLYLGCSFAPNHKGMPVLAAGDQTDFLRRQVLTSRNVRGNWFVDLALGGLNYQIEHHLFPSMPRPNLRRSQPLVRAFCQLHRVSYCETTLFRSYAQALGHLHDVGRARPTPTSQTA